jgi:hypothetical protein
MEKRCSKCKCVKPIEAFNKHHINGHQSYCKACQKAVKVPKPKKARVRLRVVAPFRLKIESCRSDVCKYEAVLMRLRRGPCVDSLLGVTKPKVAILTLRKYGWEIHSRSVRVQTKFGAVRATEYYLVK